MKNFFPSILYIILHFFSKNTNSLKLSKNYTYEHYTQTQLFELNSENVFEYVLQDLDYPIFYGTVEAQTSDTLTDTHSGSDSEQNFCQFTATRCGVATNAELGTQQHLLDIEFSDKFAYLADASGKLNSYEFTKVASVGEEKFSLNSLNNEIAISGLSSSLTNFQILISSPKLQLWTQSMVYEYNIANDGKLTSGPTFAPSNPSQDPSQWVVRHEFDGNQYIVKSGQVNTIHKLSLQAGGQMSSIATWTVTQTQIKDFQVTSSVLYVATGSQGVAVYTITGNSISSSAIFTQTFTDKETVTIVGTQYMFAVSLKATTSQLGQNTQQVVEYLRTDLTSSSTFSKNWEAGTFPEFRAMILHNDRVIIQDGSIKKIYYHSIPIEIKPTTLRAYDIKETSSDGTSYLKTHALPTSYLTNSKSEYVAIASGRASNQKIAIETLVEEKPKVVCNEKDFNEAENGILAAKIFRYSITCPEKVFDSQSSDLSKYCMNFKKFGFKLGDAAFSLVVIIIVILVLFFATVGLCYWRSKKIQKRNLYLSTSIKKVQKDIMSIHHRDGVERTGNRVADDIYRNHFERITNLIQDIDHQGKENNFPFKSADSDCLSSEQSRRRISESQKDDKSKERLSTSQVETKYMMNEK